MKWTSLVLAYLGMHISIVGVIGMCISGMLAAVCLHYAKEQDSMVWFGLALLPGFVGFFPSLGMYLIGQ
jgi:hypothetical protein